MENTANSKEDFKKLSYHLRDDAENANDPKAQALFEVSAEVIDRLQKAFSDYEKKNEGAWCK